MNGSPIPDQEDHSFIQPPAPNTAQTHPAQQKAVEILVDVGVDSPMAGRIAAAVPLPEIVRHIAAWLPRHQAQKVGVGSLVKRIFRRDPAPDPTPEFLSGRLYRKHFPDAPPPPDDLAAGEAARRQAYLPDDLADIMLGRKEPLP
jgi:hypothetical protein